MAMNHLQSALGKRNILGIGPSFFVYADSKSISTTSPMASSSPSASASQSNLFKSGANKNTSSNQSSRREFSSDPSSKSSTSARDGFDYQYLEKSILPTMKFQKSLPRLPIPKLEKTIERYLSALEPIIENRDQYLNTVKIAHAFKDNEGASLHEQLVKEDKANKDTSYISKPWFDMYLKSRAPLVLNFNPFMAWKDDPDPKFMRVDIRATNMIISALRFRRSLSENLASPEVFHLNPSKSDTTNYR